MDFKIGDVVQLKSGGPHMTIRGLSEGKAFCGWFNLNAGTYTHEKQDFPLETLKKVAA